MHDYGLTVYQGVGNSHVYVNLTDRILPINRATTKKDFAAALREFRRLQHDYVMEVFLRETARKGLNSQPMIYAFAGSETVTNGGKKKNWVFSTVSPASIATSAFENIGYAERPSARDIGYIIATMPQEDQKSFFRSIAGGSIATISQIVQLKRVQQYLVPELEEMLEGAKDPVAFCNKLHLASINDRTRQGTGYSRSAIYDALILFLADRRLILRPYKEPAFFFYDTRSIESKMLTGESSVSYHDMKNAFYAQQETAGNTAYKQIWDRHFRPYIFSLYASTTFRGPNDLSADLFERLRDAAEGESSQERRTAVLYWLYKTFRTAHSASSLRRVFSIRKGEKPFEWINFAYSTETTNLFPTTALVNYVPDPSLLSWVDAFEKYIPTLQTKTIASHTTALNHFLSWLAIAKCSARSVKDIRRAHINDFGLSQEIISFRKYLVSRNCQPQHFNVIIKRLSDFFDAEIARLELIIRNPIRYEADRMRRNAYRAKTSRSPMSGYVLEMIRELNARDNFAFSRSRPAHHRTVTDRQDNSIKTLWFPAAAIIIDLLLTVPIRSFQARFLDSGEADAFIPDFRASPPSIEHNTSRLRQNGRREFCLCLIEGLGDAQIVGLFINTNKTSVDRDVGYEIPWCSNEIKDNILQMLSWQTRYNPIGGPVTCVERSSASKNPEVLSRIKTAFPLFRDPADEGNMPVTRDALSRYWDDLCRAVELDQMQQADGDHTLRLTDFVLLRKGGPKTERRHRSRYDLHSLRVSGITALIEAGLPPDLVMQVAGHSTIVMTLYYNKIKVGDVNARLVSALRRTADRLSVGGDEVDGEFDEIIGSLINTRKTEHKGGQELLAQNRGYGDGTIAVMSHGICPGGECHTGGEWVNETVGFRPVHRALACSLCRYRLTGPAFLPGLVLNANKLIYELREKGELIRSLNDELRTSKELKNSSKNLKRAHIESLYREIENISKEWGAEYAYVLKMQAIVNKTSLKGSEPSAFAAPIVSQMRSDEVIVRVEKRSSFSLMQKLVEGAQDWIVFAPENVVRDHREFLNEVLAANNLAPFLLTMKGEARDTAARMIGAAIVAAIPDESINELHNGVVRLDEFPSLIEAIEMARGSIECSEAAALLVIENA